MILGICDVAGKYYVPQIGSFIIYFLMVALMLLFPARPLRADAPEARAAARAPCGARRGCRRPRGDPPEIAFWVLALAAFFVFPDYRVLGSQILIAGLFAVSLDLILGYARHRLARSRGVFRHRRVYGGDPRRCTAGASRSAGSSSRGSSGCRRRLRDELSRRARAGSRTPHGDAWHRPHAVRGGEPAAVDHRRRRRPLRRDDGQAVRGVRVRPRPAAPRYLYSLGVLFLLFVVARRIVQLAVRPVAARHPRKRAAHARDRRAGRSAGSIAIYTISAAMAGVAGGLLAQTTQFVGLDVLGFPRSADLMIMLVLGGAGRLYGGLVGAATLHDRASLPVRSQPGLLAVLARPPARGRRAVTAAADILGALERAAAVASPREPDMTAALRTDGLTKRVRRLRRGDATSRSSSRRARGTR